MAPSLPRYVLIKFYDMKVTVFGYDEEYEGVRGSVILDGGGMYSPAAKIEVEPAESNSKYVHLRFCHNNKYLARRDSKDGFVVADSDKPEEDTSKPSCTLFEPVEADGDGNMHLIHVQTGWHAQYNGLARMCVVQFVPDDQGWDKFGFVDADSIVKLPEHVAFKGDNGKYLQAHWQDDLPYLQFSSDDPYDLASGFRVELRPDGFVRIKSDYFGKFWRLSPNWIWADESRDWSSDRLDDAFWPIRIDKDTIAFRNGENGNYCTRLRDVDWKLECLNAAVPTITSGTRMSVLELVQERKIDSVKYRMDEARIFDMMPYVGGSTITYNKGEDEMSVEVELGYETEKSTCFNRSVSVSAGVTTTIEAGVPEIFDMSIEISYSITGTLEWGETKTERPSLSAKGVVRVPPRSRNVVHYVGTKGKCNIPFSYTQQDKSSTDGKIVYSTLNDGIFTGVNCFNFQFIVEKSTPI